ncbi:NADPH-dependent F420 reductase [Microbacterium sp.]|uniref:NADPH-dependent F420 reductase n=1 Tax=Microbacterium sp. TaxID=51671 RepID=UPI003C75B7E7
MSARERLGIVGAGKIGTTIARAALDAGYDVMLSGSGTVERLALTAEILAPGATPAVTADVVGHAELIVLAVPTHRFRELDRTLFDGKVLIDTMNYWEPIDGHDPEFAADPAGSSLVVQRWFSGASVVKSLNQLGYHEFDELRRPHGRPDRLAQAVSGNDGEARTAVMQLVDRLGFDAIDAGPLTAATPLGTGGAAFGIGLSAGALSLLLAA